MTTKSPAELQAAYEARRRASTTGKSEATSCAMTLPEPGAIQRFRITYRNGDCQTIGATFAGLAEKYGPAAGVVRWELEQTAGGFW